MEELASDHLVDVLGEMDEGAGQAILANMNRDDTDEVCMLLEYAPDSAGGLMISEYLAYRIDDTLSQYIRTPLPQPLPWRSCCLW
jgi:magnesium transporter